MLLMLICTDAWAQSFPHSCKGERNWEVCASSQLGYDEYTE